MDPGGCDADHLSARTYGSLWADVGSLWVVSWNHDHRNPDGSTVVGYETVALNINVVLLFVFAILAARRSGSST